MNREEALAIWAPEGSPWSPWAKAVLFSFMANEISDIPPNPGPVWHVPLLQSSALIVDLAGATGVEVGMSLAHSGYRPIPLYNACLHGFDTPENDGFQSLFETRAAARTSAPSVIDVAPIMRAMASQTSVLKALPLPLSAPPAFLLDANRQNAAFSPDATWFDNRSIVRDSDLPSAAFLQDHGIEQVIVIRANRELQSDLQAVLLSWQLQGLAIFRQATDMQWDPVRFTVPRMSLLTNWWNTIQNRSGYRVNSLRAFGRFVHGSSS
jgi:hypothetical protein